MTLGFLLKTNTQSDTGVATAQVAMPGTVHLGTSARVRIRAAGTPCVTGTCVSPSPLVAIVPEPLAIRPAAVPEPTALSLAALALFGVPLMQRRTACG